MEQNFELKLFEDCKSFRNAVERVKSNLSILDIKSLLFTNFPGGSCERTSTILGSYLLELGYKSIEIVNGGFSGLQRHVWIEIDEYLVDITADQFNSSIEVTDTVFGSKQAVEVTKDKASWQNAFPIDVYRKPAYILSDSNRVDREFQSDLKLIRAEIERQAANSA